MISCFDADEDLETAKAAADCFGAAMENPAKNPANRYVFMESKKSALFFVALILSSRNSVASSSSIG